MGSLDGRRAAFGRARSPLASSESGQKLHERQSRQRKDVAMLEDGFSDEQAVDEERLASKGT